MSSNLGSDLCGVRKLVWKLEKSALGLMLLVVQDTHYATPSIFASPLLSSRSSQLERG